MSEHADTTGITDGARSVRDALRGAFTGPALSAKALRTATAIVAFLFALDTPGLLKFTGEGWTDFSLSWDGVLNSLPTITNGGSQGTLYGLLAVGLILIYRTNKIINFAVAAIGAVPAVFAVLLVLTKGVPWLVAFPVALAGGAAFGALVDIIIVRRFRDSPRLIVTVATIGIAQIFAFVNLYVPRWLGIDGLPPGNFSDKTPFGGPRFTNAQGILYGTGNNIAALVAVVACALGLQVFFKRSRLGIALRASAENADRAGLLGIPVKRVQTISWAIAGLFGATVIFFQASVTSVPLDGTLGYGTLLFALAAAVVARMESIPTAVLAGVGIGIIDFATVQNVGESSISTAVMLVFILVALLFQKGGGARAKDTGVSSFKALQEFRPVPPELRDLPAIRNAKIVLGAVVLVALVAAPFAVGDADLTRLTFLPVFAMVGLSLVVLTGWAGQISLGQFAFVGVGAVTAGKLFVDHGWDFWLTLIAAAAAGAVVAALVGLPALRVQGLLLAVTSLALAAAAQGYLFVDKNSKYKVGQAILPSDRLDFAERPVLWGRIDYRRLVADNGPFSGDRGFYYFCVVALLLMFLAASSYRRNHGGRLLIAARDNEKAAQSYSISVIRTRLAAFAVSGAMASVAGALFFYLLVNVNPEDYGIANSIDVFVATVIGGLTSLGGAIAGVIIVKGIALFGENLLDGLSLLVTGPGLLVVLLFLPGGLAQGFFSVRDRYLRHLAAKHDIVVPSLIADLRVEDDGTSEDDTIITRAEHHAEEIEHAEIVTCPICGEAFSPKGAVHHEHFRPRPDAVEVVEPHTAVPS